MAPWGLCPRHLQHLGWGLRASPPRAPAPLPSASTEDSRDRRIGLSTLQARARGSVNTSFGSCFQLFGSNASSRARSSSGLSPVMYMGLTKPRARGQHRPSPVPRQELCQGWVPVPGMGTSAGIEVSVPEWIQVLEARPRAALRSRGSQLTAASQSGKVHPSPLELSSADTQIPHPLPSPRGTGSNKSCPPQAVPCPLIFHEIRTQGFGSKHLLLISWGRNAVNFSLENQFISCNFSSS